MIKGTVKGQSLVLSYPVTVSDTIGYLTAEFIFLEHDWDGLCKWAHFKKGEEAYAVQLHDGRITGDDHLNLSAGEWDVYLHGTEVKGGEILRRITTVSRPIIVSQSGVLEGEPLPITPPSVGEQILAAAEQALSTVQSVKAEVVKRERELEVALSEIIKMQEQLIGGVRS